MLFNSYSFILIFLPVFLCLYFVGNRIRNNVGIYIIITGGLLFYFIGADQEAFIILILSSAVNYAISWAIEYNTNISKALLGIDIAANAGLLLYYKFATDPESVVMPLGISFFTFQMIMYVVGVYRKEIEKADLVEYLAYVFYFPKLIMGPLADPVDLITQIKDPDRKRICADNIASGIKLFSFGLFKKMILADTFRKGVNWGFDNPACATAADMFLVMVFYTFEIYFDFSGYTDMATGVSKMLNIDLPINFDSPYKALSITDFWKRWHVSLTQFFTKYIYYPLGGNRKGKARTYSNIMIVFLVSGIWHGSGWTFIAWGLLHGTLQVLERAFNRSFMKLSETVRWMYTFLAVNVLWLLFRSEAVSQWLSVLHRIIGLQDTKVSDELINVFVLPETPVIFNVTHLSALDGPVRGLSMLLFIFVAFALTLIPENNYRKQDVISVPGMISAAFAFVFAFICLGTKSVFVYNGF